MAAESRNPRYVALLALVAALILTIGTWLRPKREADDRAAGPTLPQADRSRLDRLAQRGSLESMISYFAQIAFDVSPQLVRIEETGASGVVWDSEGLIVTANRQPRFPEAVALRADRVGVVGAQTASAPPQTPIAALRAVDSGPLGPVQRIPVVVPFAGEWIVAVWRTADQGHSFAPGLFLGISKAQCAEFPMGEMLSNIPLTAAMVGGGLFDQDGRLLALIVDCQDRYAAMALESAAETLAEAVSLEGRLLTRYGIKAAPLKQREKRYFGVEKGALIQELWKGYPADAADLLPGDIIVTLDEQPVHSPEDLQILALPIAREIFELDVVRAGRNLKISLPVRTQQIQESLGSREVGVLLESPASGFRVESVVPGSRAESAGIRPGDRLLRIDQATPRSAAQVSRALANDNSKPRFVVLERGDRIWGVFLDE